MNRNFDTPYATIPVNTQHSLLAYVQYGQSVGGFLAAVLANDLNGAVARADDDHIKELASIVRWLYNLAPSNCWGAKIK